MQSPSPRQSISVASCKYLKKGRIKEQHKFGYVLYEVVHYDVDFKYSIILCFVIALTQSVSANSDETKDGGFSQQYEMKEVPYHRIYH